MKIGILANYLGTRKDILKFCQALSERTEPVLFIRKGENLELDIAGQQIQIRYYELERVSYFIKAWNLIWYYLYLLIGIKPKSFNNYAITESFKFSEIRNWVYRNFRMFILYLSRYAPQLISYDVYLKYLRRNVAIDLTDIDCYLITTEVYNDYLFYKILNEPAPKIMYVYSWDHPCKMIRFSKRIDYYLVWNDGLRNDLHYLQFIPLEKIHIWGATQFTEIYNYINSADKADFHEYDTPFFYFVCATGKTDLLKAEVDLILKVSSVVESVSPHVKIVVRKYPFWRNSTLYQPLTKRNNLMLEEDHSNNSYQKYFSAERAIALFHLGTTLGLEICYFNTPSLFITFSETSMLDKFIHQYQNDKYLNQPKYSNVVHNEMELRDIVKSCLIGAQRIQLLEYNHAIASTTGLKSINVLADDFVSLISKLMKNDE